MALGMSEHVVGPRDSERYSDPGFALDDTGKGIVKMVLTSFFDEFFCPTEIQL